MKNIDSAETDTTICDKHNILLKKTNKENIYKLEFSVVNDNINLEHFLNWNVYKLLYELNKDILCDMKIEDTHTKDKKNVYFLFKRFGQDLGLLQKYMLFTVVKENLTSTTIQYKSIPFADDKYDTKTREPLQSNYSILQITGGKHNLHIVYTYHIDLEENLPKSMRNIAGILIKKLFWRVKTFIENMQ